MRKDGFWSQNDSLLLFLQKPTPKRFAYFMRRILEWLEVGLELHFQIQKLCMSIFHIRFFISLHFLFSYIFLFNKIVSTVCRLSQASCQCLILHNRIIIWHYARKLSLLTITDHHHAQRWQDRTHFRNGLLPERFDTVSLVSSGPYSPPQSLDLMSAWWGCGHVSGEIRSRRRITKLIYLIVFVETFLRHFDQTIDFMEVQCEHHAFENAGRSFQQHKRRIEFHGGSCFHHQHTIWIDYCVQTMRNRQNGTLGEFASNRLLNEWVRAVRWIENQINFWNWIAFCFIKMNLLRIHIRCGLIQHQDFIFSQNGASQTDELPLTNAEIASMCCDLSIQTDCLSGHIFQFDLP